MSKKIHLQFWVITAIIILAAATRLIPHAYNFSPLGAIALFGAAHFARKVYAVIIPLAATWLSDLFLNNVIYKAYFPEFTWIYPGFYWIYGSYLLIVLAGIGIFSKITVVRTAIGALSASAIFFIVSNFGVWAAGGMYPKTFEGLMLCYTAALPFLQGTLTGDIIFSTLLFGGYYLLQRRFVALRPQAQSYA
jgi:hypothetical protein